MQPIAKHLTAAIPPMPLDATRDPRQDAHEHVTSWPWRFEVYHPGLAPVLPAVQAFCSAVIHRESPKRWLSLLGPSGVGKTHLLKQAFACLSASPWRIKTPTGQRRPQMAHIVPAVDLTDFRAPLDYSRYDLIYIEDIGSGTSIEKGSGSVLRSRIAELLQLRSNRWTMIDANLYRREIDTQIDGRIASRLKRDGSWMIEIGQEVPDFWA